MNLVEMLTKQLGGAVAGQIGKSIGLDEKTATSGIGALIPTILGGLLNQVSKPGGADKLDKTLSQDDFSGSIMDNLGGALSGGKSDVLSKLGGSLLPMVFGDKGSMIGGLLGKLTGMDSGKSSSLIALVLPLVMSFLGKQKRTSNLDAMGLANLLTSQKSNIASAMPKELSEGLGLGSLLGSAKSAVSSASASASRAASEAQESGGGLMKLLLPLLLLAAVAFLVWKFVLAPKPDQGGVTLPGGANITVPNVELPNLPKIELPTELAGFPDLAKEMSSTFGSISDEASANSALPKLGELNDKLGGFATSFGAMPAEAKKTAGTVIGSMLQPIQDVINKVLAIPGVGPIIQPIADKLMENIKALTGQ